MHFLGDCCIHVHTAAGDVLLHLDLRLPMKFQETSVFKLTDKLDLVLMFQRYLQSIAAGSQAAFRSTAGLRQVSLKLHRRPAYGALHSRWRERCPWWCRDMNDAHTVFAMDHACTQTYTVDKPRREICHGRFERPIKLEARIASPVTGMHGSAAAQL